MRRLAAALLLVSGCATAAEEVPVRGGGGTCDSAKAKGLVGRARGESLGREALRLTGARTLRWIPKGAMVTMDYREGRVNLHLDSKGKVVRVACG